MLRRAWLFLLVLFAVSLTASATVHAGEALGSAAISCSGETHTDGDRDQVPADADQGVPHHHSGCHGHVVALEPGASAPVPHPRPMGDAFSADIVSLASLPIDPALRPPRA